jgi:hypothetical protein
MDLKQFVKSSLTDVMAAIVEAQQEWLESGRRGAINPVIDRIDEKAIKEISFDVAVTAGSESSGKAGAGIQVVGVRLGGDLTDATSQSSVSRIQFTVPIIPPTVTVEVGFAGPLPSRRGGVV